jgi:hypothetical protein
VGVVEDSAAGPALRDRISAAGRRTALRAWPLLQSTAAATAAAWLIAKYLLSLQLPDVLGYTRLAAGAASFPAVGP